MDRRKFLNQTILGTLGLILAPKIIKNNNGLVFDGVDQSIKVVDLYNGFDFSNIECFYDFTDEKYSLKDPNGNIVGWRDISGNGHDALFIQHTSPIENPYKKFAIAKNINESFTDELAERMLNS